ncbi:hypothetical protein Y1Q_0013680 [Alligator mississippiensis]|uniref:Uncharacterized protein n=1 Tax=Alligator mississippiensis TaxID=8496 RepID=A0A151P3Y9_ALLMI|nr:hypothetical protein Y1Q_0013680 [Alligator mississippiensis]
MACRQKTNREFCLIKELIAKFGFQMEEEYESWGLGKQEEVIWIAGVPAGTTVTSILLHLQHNCVMEQGTMGTSLDNIPPSSLFWLIQQVLPWLYARTSWTF